MERIYHFPEQSQGVPTNAASPQIRVYRARKVSEKLQIVIIFGGIETTLLFCQNQY